jgi:hypothetical protein
VIAVIFEVLPPDCQQSEYLDIAVRDDLHSIDGWTIWCCFIARMRRRQLRHYSLSSAVVGQQIELLAHLV